MKFFLEFVSCCGLAGGAREEVAQAARREAEESRALVRKVSATERVQRRKKRIRSVDSAGEWKPTLQAISEHNAVAAEHRAEKRKSSIGGGGARDIASIASYRDDHKRNHFPTAIPAFSATPFMI